MIADYYARSAVAASQAIEGFDEDRFRAHLEDTPVGLSGPGSGGEAGMVEDLTVRLLARLYPQLAIDVRGGAGERLRELALAINPAADLVEGAEIGIVVASGRPYHESIYAGADGWDALISADSPCSAGRSPNPFGAGAAACVAVAALFRRAFLADWALRVQADLRFSTWTARPTDAPTGGPDLPDELGETVLAGAGAIGNGTVWALRQLSATGTVHIVDPEDLELSNIQRYVLAERAHENQVKSELASAASAGPQLEGHRQPLAEFLAEHGYRWPAMLLALDSAADRIGAQASLPRFVANAWTQRGDLGVSSHSPFGGDGACVSCLYLPEGVVKNEDELVAEALGVPQHLMEIRTALHTGGSVSRALLESIAAAIDRPLDALLPFEGRTVRELYVEGFCGGAVIPLGEAGKLHADAPHVHVPLAHQSALAGVLLGAGLARHVIDGPPDVTSVTRLDVMKPVPAKTTQPQRAYRDGRCLCDDPDFVTIYQGKYA